MGIRKSRYIGSPKRRRKTSVIVLMRLCTGFENKDRLAREPGIRASCIKTIGGSNMSQMVFSCTRPETGNI